MKPDVIKKNLATRAGIIRRRIAPKAKALARSGTTASGQVADYLRDIDMGPDFELPSGMGDNAGLEELKYYADEGYPGAAKAFAAQGGGAAPAAPAGNILRYNPETGKVE